MADWSALPGSAVVLIARRFQLIEDFIAFRSICSSWRQATTLKNFCTSSSSSKLPLLMPYRYEMDDDDDDDEWSVQIFDSRNQRIDPEEERKQVSELRAARLRSLSEFRKTNPADERKVMNLSKEGGKICKFSFPELIRMEIRGSKGWLILVHGKTGNMCLFHPITRDQIPLPKVPPTVKIPVWPKEFVSAVLSASPLETSEYAVMVAFVEPPYILGRYLGFWKPGNDTWTRVDIPHCIENLNYYNGKFYALTFQAQVWRCDVSGLNPTNKAIKITESPWGNRWTRRAHLVECGGRLLIVAPFYQNNPSTPCRYDLQMVEIDVINGSYRGIVSLGSSTVFLGRNQGFSIDANQFPGIIEPNSVYFSDGSYRLAAPGPSPPGLEIPPYIYEGVWIDI